jgi:hypothetical protein
MNSVNRSLSAATEEQIQRVFARELAGFDLSGVTGIRFLPGFWFQQSNGKVEKFSCNILLTRAKRINNPRVGSIPSEFCDQIVRALISNASGRLHSVIKKSHRTLAASIFGR